MPMNKVAHVFFPLNVVALVDIFSDPNTVSPFTREYCYASASWLSNFPPDLTLFILLAVGGILPDSFDKLLSNHKRGTYLQHRKDKGEWLSDREFNEMFESKRTWWTLHRTISHWWPIPIILYFIGLEPLALGWASHLLLDAMTPMGIPKFVPVPSDKETGYMRLPYLSKFEGLSDITAFLMLGTFAYLSYLSF